MESNELLALIEKLPPESKKKVEDMVESLAPKSNEILPARGYGAWKGFITYMAPDFDAPLKDFHDYSYNISLEFVEKIERLPTVMQQELEAIVDEMTKTYHLGEERLAK
jgi:hypothetical protein